MKRIAIGLPVLAVLAATAAVRSCAAPAEATPTAAAPGDGPDAPADGLHELVMGNTAFAFDLYHEVAKAKGNLFFSPYSISVALAMTYAGARGGAEQVLLRLMNAGAATTPVGLLLWHDSPQ
jgi:hypothetical protein